ncbi:hypothetical protein DL98DRAFT_522816 [Cadophora sp. DSE1049]|nr:hypothetical protein DL98DRAFT_522816 [Cadophora sp. DSE1049]
MASVPLNPTFSGKVDSTQDALIIVEACLQGVLNHIPRGPYASEQSRLAKRGNVFVYEGHSSGTNVWLDNVLWSPGTISGDFLAHYELEGSVSLDGRSEDYNADKIKAGGLVKKTLTATSNGVSHYLVAYDTEAGVTPSKDSSLQRITPRPDLEAITHMAAPFEP